MTSPFVSAEKRARLIGAFCWTSRYQRRGVAADELALTVEVGGDHHLVGLAWRRS